MNNTRRKFIQGVSAAALLPLLPAKAWAAAAAGATDTQATIHRILTCNIRVALDEDEAKGVGWSARKDICLKIIKQQQPDIVGFQEVLKPQAEDIRKYFDKYALFGFDGPEMDANPTGYHGIAKNPIMYARHRYELLAGGTYWLSETPLVAGSKSWDTARARHANWVRLREHKTGKELRIINLHLDHISGEAKIQQAKMVVQESSQYQLGLPQLLTGDFNTRFDSRVFESVRTGGWKDTYEAVHGEGEAGYTGHEFEGEKYEKGPSKGRIDYIWAHGAIQPKASKIIKDAIHGKYPSDHYFVSADVEI
ncbi:endonuclease/exonuclease/phosphatase family protein [Paraflavitalea sp. CAU 1676]|uniref:endonuclease/exonuclease/phosphatase family protein n=1 Tax=Paraflavitalea sp. CAU 1676 TaxID=3032598 RepID=UPI0023D9CCC0|nr:endonuclease/exonuclease/phosphatase family protein [Paraflavitalea sp. CAU 1676]MDF2191148.1 endonuclease/exonuclease/phosphatase family protein [Paraflavitalea sp. CAU 1676]